MILPEGLTTIGYCAFTACSGLTSVTIPASVTRIIGMTFYSCSSLTNIAVDEGSANFASVDGVMFSKNHTALIAYPAGRKDTAYQIPDGVTSMGIGAFSGCKNLTSAVIPEGVTKIENTAFVVAAV